MSKCSVFAHKSTSTPGKLAYERELISRLPKYNQTHPWIITLVGCSDGLDRHINFFNSLGYSTEKIIIVERDLETFVSLKKLIELRNLNCTIIMGDFMHNLELFLSKGYKFGIVDYDGTESINLYLFLLLELIKENKSNIVVFHAVATGRATIQAMRDVEAIANDLSMSRVARKIHKPIELQTEHEKGLKYTPKMWSDSARPAPRDVVKTYISKAFEGCQLFETTYSSIKRSVKGGSNMLAYLIINS